MNTYCAIIISIMVITTCISLSSHDVSEHERALGEEARKEPLFQLAEDSRWKILTYALIIAVARTHRDRQTRVYVNRIFACGYQTTSSFFPTRPIVAT